MTTNRTTNLVVAASGAAPPKRTPARPRRAAMALAVAAMLTATCGGGSSGSPQVGGAAAADVTTTEAKTAEPFVAVYCRGFSEAITILEEATAGTPSELSTLPERIAYLIDIVERYEALLGRLVKAVGESEPPDYAAESYLDDVAFGVEASRAIAAELGKQLAAIDPTSPDAELDVAGASIGFTFIPLVMTAAISQELVAEMKAGDEDSGSFGLSETKSFRQQLLDDPDILGFHLAARSGGECDSWWDPDYIDPADLAWLDELVADPGMLESSSAPGGDDLQCHYSAEEVTTCLIDAWRAGDRAAADELASPDVVDLLFEGSPSHEWMFQGCTETTCAYLEPDPGGEHGVRIELRCEVGTGGWRVVELTTYG